jgi:hypothetical protein
LQPPNSPEPIIFESHHIYLTFTTDEEREGKSLRKNLADRLDSGLRLDRVESVTANSVQEEVFDLTVDQDACFIANGLVVHNTRWHNEDVFGLIIKDEAMRRRYGILIQRIYPECQDITAEFYYPATAQPTQGRLDHLLAPRAS